MAIVENGIGKFLSGSIEGMVFVKGKYRTYMRSMPRERKASGWSEKQKQQRNGFGSVIRFAGEQKFRVIIPIWNKAAQNINMSGFNLFVKANRAAFDAQGKVSNPALLHFSTGELPLPYMLWAGADTQNPGSIAIRWTDQLGDALHADDQLMAVFYHDGAKAPFNTGFKRKDQRGQIANPIPNVENSNLFLFFWNEKLDVYSSDQVFKV